MLVSDDGDDDDMNLGPVQGEKISKENITYSSRHIKNFNSPIPLIPIQ